MIDFKNTLALRGYGLLKIPLLFIVQPTVVSLTPDACEVRIPLNYWTRNHLKSMYFGTLAIGADCSGGVLALKNIEELSKGKKVGLIFKDFQANFKKRAEADVHFHCKDGPAIRKILQKTLKTGERVDTPLKIWATTPKISGDEKVAEFILTLSLKAGR